MVSRVTTPPAHAARALSCLIAITLCGPVAATAQGPEASANGAALPRTPWGDPDLQGIWDYWTFTPLERPAEFADRDVLTAEEAAVVARQSNEEALARDAPPPPGQVGGYSQAVWTDRARATALTQPSLLIDPPDGKLPPLTPQARQRATAATWSRSRAAGRRRCTCSASPAAKSASKPTWAASCPEMRPRRPRWPAPATAFSA